jgi:DNA-binding protein HU-beta
MRKADIVTAISEKTGLAKVDVLVTLETFFNEVRDTMGNGENVYIRGFGSFVIKRRASKMGRNIKRGKTVQIPEHYIPSFKPAKVFTEHVKSKVTSLPEDDGADD